MGKAGRAEVDAALADPVTSSTTEPGSTSERPGVSDWGKEVTFGISSQATTEKTIMSDVVYKYPVELRDTFSVTLPRFCQILTVQVQDGKPFMWIKHTLNTTKIISRRFRLARTGRPIDEPKSPDGQMTGDVSGPTRWQYVNSFQLLDGKLIFHLFVESNPMGLP